MSIHRFQDLKCLAAHSESLKLEPEVQPEFSLMFLVINSL